ncbi:hypothetical protein Vadar_006681 [Vaccinium darrowii]|uniref:Uncharacterized protein n=1 Tax=Vaccinium darrowii TaxID=229202 RepID=A0ACB7WYQ2_9ERIC|nr:hypothetical protein Vadar_006681 [Vaccinium darrowii]
MHKPKIQELRWWAFRHLEKIRKVEMFLACDTDAERHQWLYYENLAAIEEHHRGQGPMLFSSWLFGDNNKSNSNQGHTSSNDAEVNSHAHYVTPMGCRSDTYGCSFKGHGNFEPGRSSFHFGAPTHENSNQFRGHEDFEPGRSSFHFGEQSHHYSTPFVAQFQRDQSTFLYGYTFNVLAVADFNLCFTFAVSGYEESMHEYQIFKEETAKRGNRYPHPPASKCYLVDAGYPNTKGYMAPYKGFMYH